MIHNHSTVGVFNTHESAEAAIRRLSEASFPINQLSIIGTGYETEEQVIGFFNLGDRVKLWGKNGALWGGLWGLLSAVVIGGLGALAGALASIGVPNDSVLRYEQDLRAENFLVVVHGSQAEAQRAQGLLTAAEASRVEVHTPQSAGVPTTSPVGSVGQTANHSA